MNNFSSLIARTKSRSESDRYQRHLVAQSSVIALLHEGGITDEELYLSNDLYAWQSCVTGEVDVIGRRLRRNPCLPSQSRERQRHVRTLYGSYAPPQNTNLRQIVLRRQGENVIDINHLGDAQRSQFSRLSADLRNACRRRVLEGRVSHEIASSEVVPHADGGHVVDLHFHVGVRVNDNDRTVINDLVSVLRGYGWDAWADDDDHSCDDAALITYTAKGFGGSVAGRLSSEGTYESWSAAALAILYRQSKGLEVVRLYGSLRAHAGAVEEADSQIRAAIIKREKAKLQSQAGVSIAVAIGWHDFNGEVHRAILLKTRHIIQYDTDKPRNDNEEVESSFFDDRRIIDIGHHRSPDDDDIPW